MIYFNACPKCHGDLTMGQDSYGSFVSCLQCGFMRDIETKPVAGAKAPVGGKAPVAAPLWYSADEEQLAKAA